MLSATMGLALLIAADFFGSLLDVLLLGTSIRLLEALTHSTVGFQAFIPASSEGPFGSSINGKPR